NAVCSVLRVASSPMPASTNAISAVSTMPLGTRGIVLTALIAFVLAGVGLLATRNTLHTALTADENLVGADVVEHRLHAAVVAAIIAVVVIVAAGVTAAVVWSGPSTKPAPPATGGQFGPVKASGLLRPDLSG